MFYHTKTNGLEVYESIEKFNRIAKQLLLVKYTELVIDSEIFFVEKQISGLSLLFISVRYFEKRTKDTYLKICSETKTSWQINLISQN